MTPFYMVQGSGVIDWGCRRRTLVLGGHGHAITDHGEKKKIFKQIGVILIPKKITNLYQRMDGSDVSFFHE